METSADDSALFRVKDTKADYTVAEPYDADQPGDRGMTGDIRCR